jgi:bacterial/archaeal transporter family-2 protein
MQNLTLVGLIVALGSGLAIGIQSTLFTMIGRSIGPVRGSLVVNVTAGIIAGFILMGALAIQGRAQWRIPGGTLLPAVIAVILGLFIVAGISLAFQRTGLAAGVVTVFLGQMLISVIVDALGLAGAEVVPLDVRRVVGLVVMAVAVVLLVPQK